MSAGRSVLVTGGSGFIGRHLVPRLVAAGHRVTLLQRSDWCTPGVREMLQVEDLAPAGLRGLLGGRSFDWLAHLAGAGIRPADRDIETLFRINLDVTRVLTQIAADWPARAVFVAGSGSEYAFAGKEDPAVETSPLEAYRLYGASKAAASLAAASIATALNVPLAVGRLFGVYGPGEPPHRLLPSLFTGLRAGQRVALSAGGQRRDFVYVDDVIDAIFAIFQALERDPAPMIVNIAVGWPVSVRAFAMTVADVLGVSHALLGFGDLSARPDDIPFFSGDPTLMRAYTGWQPRHDLKSGITRAVKILTQA